MGSALGRELLLTLAGGSASFHPPSDVLTSAPSGGWCWFQDPRAVYFNGVSYFGYVDGSNGNVCVRSYAHATGAVSAATVLHAALEVDDHVAPSLLVRPSDHRVIAFYSAHLGPALYMRVSTNPEDISAFGAETDLDSAFAGSQYTYPSPVYTSSDTTIWLFTRSHVAGVAYWWYSASADGGVTWPAVVHLHSQTYSKIVSNGTDRIDVACCMHPNGDDGPDIYQIKHLYRESAAWHQSDGTVMSGSLPFAGTDMSVVYDGGASPVWVWDIAYGLDGNPVIGFVRFNGGDTGDHRYMWARWTGSAWDVHEIAAGGGAIPTATIPGQPTPQPYYSGGMALDHADPTTVYCSIGRGSDAWDIYRYTTADDGATWAGAALTGGGKNVRPVVVRDHPGDLSVLWLTGRYTDYIDYAQGVSGA